MATRSARRALGARAILAAGILALSASIIPAHAVGNPTVVDTSVDSGWTKHATVIGASYDLFLAQTSTAVLVDGNSAPVAGTVLVQDAGIAFTASAPLAGVNGPYTMTWTAVSASTPASTTITRTFSVDTAVPAPPALQSPEGVELTPYVPFDFPEPVGPTTIGPYRGIGAVRIALYAPGDTITIAGTAEDRRGVNSSVTYTSGLKKVTISFYDMFGDLDPAQTINVAGTCASNKCAYAIDFTGDNAITLEDLPSGLWTVQAVAFDQAGNKSGESNPVTFNKM